MNEEPYEPQVDDYVVWERESWSGTFRDEGWIYFKCDPIEPKRGFPTPARYITIETGVKLKPPHQLEDNPKHKYVHTLLLCYEHCWNELKFVKRRTSKHCEHYSQYDDIHGNEDHVHEKKQKDSDDERMTKMYKSQEGRQPDY